MFDAYSRRIDYLRISVTDRCNLRCRYCMPSRGSHLIPNNDTLRIEELETVAAYAIKQGMTKIRLTGGEPLVRKGIVTLVEKISNIPGLGDFGMTTNGTLLSRFAGSLKQAGLHRLNISMDTTDPHEFRRITRGGNINDLFSGIAAAAKAGFTSIKLNCVVEKGIDEPNATSVRAFAAANNLEARFIHRMNTAKGEFRTVIGGLGGHCSDCNRLRLSSDGLVYPCLFSDIAFSVRHLGIPQAFSLALRHKPESGCKSHNQFYRIGG